MRFITCEKSLAIKKHLAKVQIEKRIMKEAEKKNCLLLVYHILLIKLKPTDPILNLYGV